MRTNHLNTITGAAALGLALYLGPTTSVRADSRHSAEASAPITAPGHVRRVTKHESDRSAGHLSGAELHARDGSTIGRIKDFLIDTHTGRIQYAVVSTGGFIGIGDKLHLVPFAMLQEPAGNHGFTASITKDELDQSPVVNDDEYKHDRVAVDSPEAQQIVSAFPSAVGNTNAGGAQSVATLVRATKFDGRDLDASGGKVGRVKGVVIDRGATHAMVLVAPQHGSGNLLVPFDRLTIPANKDQAITTTLEPSEFGAAAPEPTGMSSAEQNHVDSTIATDRSQVAAARAIRRALDQDSSLAHANVDVTPSNRHVLVHGTVPSKAEKDAVMQRADAAAPNATIDFDLNVQTR